MTVSIWVKDLYTEIPLVENLTVSIWIYDLNKEVPLVENATLQDLQLLRP